MIEQTPLTDYQRDQIRKSIEADGFGSMSHLNTLFYGDDHPRNMLSGLPMIGEREWWLAIGICIGMTIATFFCIYMHNKSVKEAQPVVYYQCWSADGQPTTIGENCITIK